MHAHADPSDRDRILGRLEVDEALEWAADDPDQLRDLFAALAEIAAEDADQFTSIVARIAVAAGYQPSRDGTRRALVQAAGDGSTVLRSNRTSAFDW